jgi:hypothetical protein
MEAYLSTGLTLAFRFSFGYNDSVDKNLNKYDYFN